jgi:hypothetical protein
VTSTTRRCSTIGSGWGSMAGGAAERALAGFEGGAGNHGGKRGGRVLDWQDLGERWLTVEQNIKQVPVCRTIHAPVRRGTPMA